MILNRGLGDFMSLSNIIISTGVPENTEIGGPISMQIELENLGYQVVYLYEKGQEEMAYEPSAKDGRRLIELIKKLHPYYVLITNNDGAGIEFAKTMQENISQKALKQRVIVVSFGEIERSKEQIEYREYGIKQFADRFAIDELIPRYVAKV